MRVGVSTTLPIFSRQKPEFFAENPKMIHKLHFLIKLRFSSNVFFGHVECRFGNRVWKIQLKRGFFWLNVMKGWRKILFTKILLNSFLGTLRNLFWKSSQKFFIERPKRMRNLLRKSLFSSNRSSGNPESSFDNPTEKSSPAYRKTSAGSQKKN